MRGVAHNIIAASISKGPDISIVTTGIRVYFFTGINIELVIKTNGKVSKVDCFSGDRIGGDKSKFRFWERMRVFEETVWLSVIIRVIKDPAGIKTSIIPDPYPPVIRFIVIDIAAARRIRVG